MLQLSITLTSPCYFRVSLNPPCRLIEAGYIKQPLQLGHPDLQHQRKTTLTEPARQSRGPPARCSAHSAANTLPLKEISSSCVNHGGLFKKALPTAHKRLVEGKQEKFGLWEAAHVKVNSSDRANNVQVCSFVKKGNSVLDVIVWKQSLLCVYEWDFPFPGDSKHLTSLEHDKSVTTYVSVGTAINFLLLPVSDFISFS